jgi:CRP/FNR family transcriptional regulator, dissimilatory nitrate respiration regulator
MDGTEAVVDVVTKGHIFGQFSMFDHGTYDASAQAIEDMSALLIPTRMIQQIMEQNHRLALNMLHSMAFHRRMQTMEIEHLAVQNAPQRIGCFLLRLCKASNHTHPNAPIELHLPYDKTLIAARLGMKAETFSRALAKLKEETGITIKGSTITVHGTDSLSIYSCNNCSSQFPCDE